jgi:hypothetical protein
MNKTVGLTLEVTVKVLHKIARIQELFNAIALNFLQMNSSEDSNLLY